MFTKKSRFVKFKDNRSFLTKVADFNEVISNKIKELWPLIFIILALGIVGKMDFEDQICKNQESQQCIEYKAEQK